MRVPDPPGGHGLGLSPGLAVGLLVVFAGYAVVLALVVSGAESVWGAWAAAGYGAAALVSAWFWRRRPMVPLAVALAGAFVVPAAVLPVNWGATSEGRVVARAASLWLAHGTPYLASTQLSSWRAYDPYLPGMSLFGLPHALGLPGLLGAPRSWLALCTLLLLVAACRIVAPGSARRCSGCRRRAWVQALLLVAFPAFALPMALGVTDPPVIALVCLALAWAARPPAGASAGAGAGAVSRQSRGRGRGQVDECFGPVRHGHPLLAAVAVGIACALKATAWPALPVVLALVAVRDGRRTAVRFAGAAVASAAGLVAVTAPALLTHPRSLWQNIVAYPLGLSRRRTPAGSPLPGHLLATAGGAGHEVAILLLAVSALAVGASLVLRPPRTVEQAVLRLAIGLSLLFLLAPDSRFGYFAYPAALLAWLLLAAGRPGRRLGEWLRSARRRAAQKVAGSWDGAGGAVRRPAPQPVRLGSTSTS